MTKKILFSLIFFFVFTFVQGGPGDPEDPLDRPQGMDKPRVLISTDIGGGDEDDMQTFVRYLMYSDMFETEGLVASPPQAGRKADLLKIVDLYEQDYAHLKTWSWFLHPDSLRAVTKQGATGVGAPASGQNTEGSDLIVARGKVDDPRPLWILVWGSITDVAQALYDAPEIKENIRVYTIGSWNTRQDQAAHKYVQDVHKSDLWWIENDVSFRGMYQEGNLSGTYNNVTYSNNIIGPYGALGNFYKSLKSGSLKEGDSPSILYLLGHLLGHPGDPDDPTQEHWGGQFVKVGDMHYDDLTDEFASDAVRSKMTVAKWREQFADHFANRIKWTTKDNPVPLPVIKPDTCYISPGETAPDSCDVTITPVNRIGKNANNNRDMKFFREHFGFIFSKHGKHYDFKGRRVPLDGKRSPSIE
ncbi:MAG: DUF1593 domain-containing protein [Fibrobacteria bacterium]|nr:DUF1593 domain-containing protein [Fibrobacteria bacterium]